MKNAAQMPGQIQLFDLLIDVPVDCNDSSFTKEFDIMTASLDEIGKQISLLCSRYEGINVPNRENGLTEDMKSAPVEIGMLINAALVKMGYKSTYVLDQGGEAFRGFVQCASEKNAYNGVEYTVARSPFDMTDEYHFWCFMFLCRKDKSRSRRTYEANYHANPDIMVENIVSLLENGDDIIRQHDNENKKASRASKKEQKSPISEFIKKNNGIVIEDWCSVTSDDFKSFCRKLKNALKKEALLVGFDDLTLQPNHYDMSGFFRKGDKYIYWSFSVMRGDQPTFLDKTDAFNGFLYRTAKNNKDFRGGNNHFTDLKHLCSEAMLLIENPRNWQ